MESVFYELKETLWLELSRSDWAVGHGRDVLLKKLGDMKMSIPETSYVDNLYKKVNSNTIIFESLRTLFSIFTSFLSFKPIVSLSRLKSFLCLFTAKHDQQLFREFYEFDEKIQIHDVQRVT